MNRNEKVHGDARKTEENKKIERERERGN